MALSIALAPLRAAAFPADADWNAVLINGVLMIDDVGDAVGSRNVVGDATHGSFYAANDGVNMYFRIRLDQDPSGTGGQGALRSFGWGVVFDTDMDANNYEWMIMLDGISNPEEIALWQNTVQAGPNDPSDPPEIQGTTIALVGNMRVVAADTSLNGDQDFFLDWQFPYATFKADTGVTDQTPLRIFAGSSGSATSLSAAGGDYLGGPNLSDGISDYMAPFGNLLATGAVKFASDLTGAGDETTVAPNDPVFIRVDDADLNQDNAVLETTTVTVTSPFGESETVTLTETGVDTGIFTATLATLKGVAAGTDDDGTLVVADGQVVQVDYDDAGTFAGTPATVSDTINVVQPPGTAGAVSATASILPGETISVSVTDADLNANAGLIETVDVTLSNGATGELETITLTETGVNTGVFTGTLATTFGASAGTDDDGVMKTQAGDVVTTSYNDELDGTGNLTVRTAATNATGGADGALSAAASILPGQGAALSVTDADLNANAGLAETATVSVVNDITGESETVTLTETGINTGVFTGALATTFGTSAGTDNDGTMNAQAGDNLTASYADALTAAGDSAVRTDATAVTGGVDGTLSATVSIMPGGGVVLTVADADLDANPALAETAAALVVNSATGESETVTLTETGVNTGVFTATLATAFGTSSGADNNGTMNVQASDSLASSYADALTAAGGSAVRSDSTAVAGGADAF